MADTSNPIYACCLRGTGKPGQAVILVMLFSALVLQVTAVSYNLQEAGILCSVSLSVMFCHKVKLLLFLVHLFLDKVH